MGDRIFQFSILAYIRHAPSQPHLNTHALSPKVFKCAVLQTLPCVLFGNVGSFANRSASRVLR
jgi:hypothetical protein